MMAKARNFRELEAKMPLESRERVAARVKETLDSMSLEQLRAARELTQTHLAELLHVEQGSISKMERRADMYVGTLSKFIEAMGGQLEIRANFPEGSVRITQFGEGHITQSGREPSSSEDNLLDALGIKGNR